MMANKEANMKLSQTMPQLNYTREDIQEQYLSNKVRSEQQQNTAANKLHRLAPTGGGGSGSSANKHRALSSEQRNKAQVEEELESASEQGPNSGADLENFAADGRGQGSSRRPSRGRKRRRDRSRSASLFSACFSIPNLSSMLTSQGFGAGHATGSGNGQPSQRRSILAHLGLATTTTTAAANQIKQRRPISASQTLGNLQQAAGTNPIDQVDAEKRNRRDSNQQQQQLAQVGLNASRKHVSFGGHNQRPSANNEQPAAKSSLETTTTTTTTTTSTTTRSNANNNNVIMRNYQANPQQLHQLKQSSDAKNSPEKASNLQAPIYLISQVSNCQPQAIYQNQLAIGSQRQRQEQVQKHKPSQSHSNEHPQPPTSPREVSQTVYRRLPAVPMRTQATQTEITAYHLMATPPLSSGSSTVAMAASGRAGGWQPREGPPATPLSSSNTPSRSADPEIGRRQPRAAAEATTADCDTNLPSERRQVEAEQQQQRQQQRRRRRHHQNDGSKKVAAGKQSVSSKSFPSQSALRPSGGSEEWSAGEVDEEEEDAGEHLGPTTGSLNAATLLSSCSSSETSLVGHDSTLASSLQKLKRKRARQEDDDDCQPTGAHYVDDLCDSSGLPANGAEAPLGSSPLGGRPSIKSCSSEQGEAENGDHDNEPQIEPPSKFMDLEAAAADRCNWLARGVMNMSGLAEPMDNLGENLERIDDNDYDVDVDLMETNCSSLDRAPSPPSLSEASSQTDPALVGQLEESAYLLEQVASSSAASRAFACSSSPAQAGQLHPAEPNDIHSSDDSESDFARDCGTLKRTIPAKTIKLGQRKEEEGEGEGEEEAAAPTAPTTTPNPAADELEPNGALAKAERQSRESLRHTNRRPSGSSGVPMTGSKDDGQDDLGDNGCRSSRRSRAPDLSAPALDDEQRDRTLRLAAAGKQSGRRKGASPGEQRRDHFLTLEPMSGGEPAASSASSSEPATATESKSIFNAHQTDPGERGSSTRTLSARHHSYCSPDDFCRHAPPEQAQARLADRLEAARKSLDCSGAQLEGAARVATISSAANGAASGRAHSGVGGGGGHRARGGDRDREGEGVEPLSGGEFGSETAANGADKSESEGESESANANESKAKNEERQDGSELRLDEEGGRGLSNDTIRLGSRENEPAELVYSARSDQPAKIEEREEEKEEEEEGDKKGKSEDIASGFMIASGHKTSAPLKSLELEAARMSSRLLRELAGLSYASSASSPSYSSSVSNSNSNSNLSPANSSLQPLELASNASGSSEGGQKVGQPKWSQPPDGRRKSSSGAGSPPTTVSELDQNEELSTPSFVDSYRQRLVQVCQLAELLLGQVMDECLDASAGGEAKAAGQRLSDNGAGPGGGRLEIEERGELVSESSGSSRTSIGSVSAHTSSTSTTSISGHSYLCCHPRAEPHWQPQQQQQTTSGESGRDKPVLPEKPAHLRRLAGELGVHKQTPALASSLPGQHQHQQQHEQQQQETAAAYAVTATSIGGAAAAAVLHTSQQQSDRAKSEKCSQAMYARQLTADESVAKPEMDSFKIGGFAPAAPLDNEGEELGQVNMRAPIGDAHREPSQSGGGKSRRSSSIEGSDRTPCGSQPISRSASICSAVSVVAAGSQPSSSGQLEQQQQANVSQMAQEQPTAAYGDCSEQEQEVEVDSGGAGWSKPAGSGSLASSASSSAAKQEEELSEFRQATLGNPDNSNQGHCLLGDDANTTNGANANSLDPSSSNGSSRSEIRRNSPADLSTLSEVSEELSNAGGAAGQQLNRPATSNSLAESNQQQQQPAAFNCDPLANTEQDLALSEYTLGSQNSTEASLLTMMDSEGAQKQRDEVEPLDPVSSLQTGPHPSGKQSAEQRRRSSGSSATSSALRATAARSPIDCPYVHDIIPLSPPPLLQHQQQANSAAATSSTSQQQQQQQQVYQPLLVLHQRLSHDDTMEAIEDDVEGEEQEMKLLEQQSFSLADSTDCSPLDIAPPAAFSGPLIEQDRARTSKRTESIKEEEEELDLELQAEAKGRGKGLGDRNGQEEEDDEDDDDQEEEEESSVSVSQHGVVVLTQSQPRRRPRKRVCRKEVTSGNVELSPAKSGHSSTLSDHDEDDDDDSCSNLASLSNTNQAAEEQRSEEPVSAEGEQRLEAKRPAAGSVKETDYRSRQQSSKSMSTESATHAILEHLSLHHSELPLDEPALDLEQPRPIVSSQVLAQVGAAKVASPGSDSHRIRRECWRQESDSARVQHNQKEADDEAYLDDLSKLEQTSSTVYNSGTIRRNRAKTNTVQAEQPVDLMSSSSLSGSEDRAGGKGKRRPPIGQLKAAQPEENTQASKQTTPICSVQTDTSICSSCSCLNDGSVELASGGQIESTTAGDLDQQQAASSNSAQQTVERAKVETAKQVVGGTARSSSQWMSEEEGTVFTENYWLSHWLYISEQEESEIWRRAIDMQSGPIAAASQQSETGSNPQTLAAAASGETKVELANGMPREMIETDSTESERGFSSRYKSTTRKMIHRRATIEMYKRIMSNSLKREKRVEISRSNGEFGFRIHGSRPVVVSAIERGTSAETCGLQVGDLIYAINGTKILDMAHSDVVKLAHSADSSALVLDLVPTNDFLRLSKYNSANNGRYEPIVTGFLMRLSPSTAQPLLVELQERIAQTKGVSSQQRSKRLNEVMRLAWRQRYFVLRNDSCLYWYKTASDIEPFGGINLQGFSATLTNEFSEPNYVIRLVKYGGQPHYLGTNNVCDIQTWIDAINKAATEANQNDPYMKRTLTLARTKPSQIPEPDCSGYLYKFSHKRGGGAHWRAAYFVLKDACLYLFKDQQAESVVQASAVYFLHGYRVRSKHIEQKKHTFELLPPNRKTIRPVFLMASSETDKKRWIAALEYSIDRWIEID